MDIRIVPYGEKLKQQIFGFTNRCFQELGKNFEPDGRHSFYRDIPRNFAAFWCMLTGEEVVGTVALKELGGDTVELKALYLAKEYRGRGLGTRLLNKALNYARAAGYKNVVLDSMSKYKAVLSLYEKVGFKPTERYNDNAYADVFMKMELQ